MDDNNKLVIIIVFILHRCTIHGPLGIFKSPVAPFVLLFRLSAECSFFLPRAKPLYIYIFFQDVRCEFDEFRVSTHILKLLAGTCTIISG